MRSKPIDLSCFQKLSSGAGFAERLEFEAVFLVQIFCVAWVVGTAIDHVVDHGPKRFYRRGRECLMQFGGEIYYGFAGVH